MNWTLFRNKVRFCRSTFLIRILGLSLFSFYKICLKGKFYNNLYCKFYSVNFA